jgi:hypothetical protein
MSGVSKSVTMDAPTSLFGTVHKYLTMLGYELVLS